MKISSILSLLAFAWILSGCATLISDDEQRLEITTNCQSRKMSMVCVARNDKGSWRFETPASFVVKKSMTDLLISCQGGLVGDSVQFSTSALGLPIFGNVFIGGGIGALIDAKTDNIWEYPSQINVEPAMCKFADMKK
jgi:hypothetical protein